MDYIVSVKPRTKKRTTNNCNVKDIKIKKGSIGKYSREELKMTIKYFF